MIHWKPAISAAGLVLCAGMALAQRVEDNSPGFVYNGNWTSTQDAKASGASYNVSNTPGNTVTFTVNGPNFVLYRRVDPTGGLAQVTVDGKAYGKMTFYLPEVRWQIPAAIDAMGAGQHTIVLTVLPDLPDGSTGTNVYIDAVENPIPPALSGNITQTEAIARVNYFRGLMGLPDGKHHAALCIAASAHAKYLDAVDYSANGTDPHVETFGVSPFYTGPTNIQREQYAGTDLNGGTEWVNGTPQVDWISFWMDGVDHRSPFLDYATVDLGYGAAPKGITLLLDRSALHPVNPAQTVLTTWPFDGQTDVWIRYEGGDGPDNSFVSRGNYGYAISLKINQPANATQGAGPAVPVTGTLTDAAGNVIDQKIAGSQNYYTMIPSKLLAINTKYKVTMTGTDGNNNPFTKTWSFTTAIGNSVHAYSAKSSVNSYGYSVGFETAVDNLQAQVEYGPTTAYGTIVPATFGNNTYNGRPAYLAQIFGLVTAPVIHWRVSTKDAQGNVVYSTRDNIIRTATPLTNTKVDFVQSQVAGNTIFISWETAGPVTSAVVNYGPDTNYGTNVAGELQLFDTGLRTTQFTARIPNPGPGVTIHYLITATDTNGTFTTQDATVAGQ